MPTPLDMPSRRKVYTSPPTPPPATTIDFPRLVSRTLVNRRDNHMTVSRAYRAACKVLDSQGVDLKFSRDEFISLLTAANFEVFDGDYGQAIRDTVLTSRVHRDFFQKSTGHE